MVEKRYEPEKSSVFDRRANRRRFLQTVGKAGLGLTGLSIVGCGQQVPVEPAKPSSPAAPASNPPPAAANPPPAAPAPPPQAPAANPAAAAVKPTGRVVVGLSSVEWNLDPAWTVNIPHTHFFTALYDPVTLKNVTTGKVEPWLAESWRQIDDKTVEFKLRKDVKFHNGRDLTAQDVQFSLQRVLDPDHKPPLVVNQYIRDLSHADIVDANTIRVFAKQPTPLIPMFMSWVYVLPAAEMKAAGSEEAFFAKPIGSGPYMFKEAVRTSHVEMTAAEMSWRKPRLAELRYQGFTEDAARVSALRSGGADMIENVPPDQLKGLEAAGFKVQWTPVTGTYVLDLFGPPDSPHSKLEVRQAIAHAIDWETIVKEIYLGYGKTNPSLLFGGPGAVGWADDPARYPYDPKKAKELLAKAGLPNGFDTKFASSRVLMLNAVSVGEAIVGFLKDVGINVQPTFYESAANLEMWRSTYEKGRPPLVAWRGGYEILMESSPQLRYFVDQGSIHQYGWNNQEFNTLIANFLKEQDLEKRAQTLLQANRLVADNALAINGFRPPAIIVYSPKVTGVQVRPNVIIWPDEMARA